MKSVHCRRHKAQDNDVSAGGGCRKKGRTIPEVLTISSLSLSIIIGNTFDNAIEACCDLPAEQRIIHLQLRKQYRSLFYRLENPYSDTSRGIRIGEYHGYGLKNINRIVQENHGDFYTKKKDGVFTVQVRLNCEN